MPTQKLDMNIGCIEIEVIKTVQLKEALLDKNIGCIEMQMFIKLELARMRLDKNIGCIEISVIDPPKARITKLYDML